MATGVFTGGTWSRWVSTTTTTTCTSSVTWDAWNTSTAVTQTQATATWYTWCTIETAIFGAYEADRHTIDIEEQRRINIMQAEHMARMEENTRKRDEAEARAEKLLLENLSLQQRLDYEKHRYFVVHGRNKTRYRIRRGRSGNVDVVTKSGHIEHRLCAHPNEYVPDCDTMLAQKLMLEFDEANFLRVANRHPGVSGQALPALH